MRYNKHQTHFHNQIILKFQNTATTQLKKLQFTSRVGTKMHYQIFAKTKILRKFRKFSRNFRENYEIFALKFSQKFRLFHFRENIKPIFAKISFNFAKKNTTKL
jgi:hypothetical protein